MGASVFYRLQKIFNTKDVYQSSKPITRNHIQEYWIMIWDIDAATFPEIEIHKSITITKILIQHTYVKINFKVNEKTFMKYYGNRVT